MDFVLSPFAHYETIAKEAMEDWSRVFNQAATYLADAAGSHLGAASSLH